MHTNLQNLVNVFYYSCDKNQQHINRRLQTTDPNTVPISVKSCVLTVIIDPGGTLPSWCSLPCKSSMNWALSSTTPWFPPDGSGQMYFLVWASLISTHHSFTDCWYCVLNIDVSCQLTDAVTHGTRVTDCRRGSVHEEHDSAVLGGGWRGKADRSSGVYYSRERQTDYQRSHRRSRHCCQ